MLPPVSGFSASTTVAESSRAAGERGLRNARAIPRLESGGVARRDLGRIQVTRRVFPEPSARVHERGRTVSLPEDPHVALIGRDVDRDMRVHERVVPISEDEQHLREHHVRAREVWPYGGCAAEVDDAAKIPDRAAGAARVERQHASGAAHVGHRGVAPFIRRERPPVHGVETVRRAADLADPDREQRGRDVAVIVVERAGVKRAVIEDVLHGVDRVLPSTLRRVGRREEQQGAGRGLRIARFVYSRREQQSLGLDRIAVVPRQHSHHKIAARPIAAGLDAGP